MKKNEELFNIDLSAPSEVNEEMKAGLAQVYSNKGFRLYLENAIKIANINMLVYMNAANVEGAKKKANHIEALMELLKKGRDQYTNIEKIYAKKKQTSSSEGTQPKESV